LKKTHHKNAGRFVFLIIAYTFSSTKLAIRAEQILPGSQGGWGKRERVGGRGEKWPKQCMHIGINE
jgi:hypothetical protein